MVASHPATLRIPIPLPAPGESRRVVVGTWQLVVEPTAILVHDGREIDRLALPSAPARLELAPRPPQHALLATLEVLPEVAPAARLRGYAALPLTLELWVEAPEPLLLAVLRPRALRTAWRPGHGYTQRARARFQPRPPGDASEALVPLLLRNRGTTPWRLETLTLSLAPGAFALRRGRLVARGQRVVRTAATPRARLTLVAALLGILLPACTPQGEPGTQDLLREIRALRASSRQDEALRAEVQQSFAPLREGLAALLAAQRAGDQRSAELAAQVGEALALVRGSAQDDARAKVEALQRRLAELEQGLRQQASAREQSEELILRALDATATKLDGFLQRAQALTAPSGEGVKEVPVKVEGAPPAAANGGKGASLWPWIVLPLGVLAGLWALLRRFRPRSRPVGGALQRDAQDDLRLLAESVGDLGAEPDPALAALDAPAPAHPAPAALATVPAVATRPAPDAGSAAPPPPAVCLELATRDPARARAAVMRLLEEEPCVLVEPAPAVRAGASCVAARFCLVPDATAQEGARVRARLERAAGA